MFENKKIRVKEFKRNFINNEPSFLFVPYMSLYRRTHLYIIHTHLLTFQSIISVEHVLVYNLTEVLCIIQTYLVQ